MGEVAHGGDIQPHACKGRGGDHAEDTVGRWSSGVAGDVNLREPNHRWPTFPRQVRRLDGGRLATVFAWRGFVAMGHAFSGLRLR